jgi:hypothetical protein
MYSLQFKNIFKILSLFLGLDAKQRVYEALLLWG